MNDDDRQGKQPPPAAALLRDFVNTFEPQTGRESIPTPAALSRWLVAHALLPTEPALAAQDLSRARAFREGLRSVLLVHAGHEPDAAAMAALVDVVDATPVRLAVGPAGVHLTTRGSNCFDAALVTLLDAVRSCEVRHDWERLKVCSRDTCRWAYYDASRNSSRRWCSMAGCGNVMKMRRSHHKASGPR